MKHKNKKDPVIYLWQQLHNYLQEYLPAVRNASPYTVSTYRDSLQRFIDFLTEKEDITRDCMDYEVFSRHHIKEYLLWLHKEKALKPNTCNLRLTVIRSFLEYSAQEDLTLMPLFNEVCSIKNLRVPSKPIEYLQKDEMKALLESVETKTKTGRRNRMMLVFQYDTALRVGELINVRLGDLYLNGNTPFLIVIGKGRKQRSVPLMEKTVAHLNLFYREFHSEENLDRQCPLFYSRRDGKPHMLSTDSVEKLLKKYASVARANCPNIPQDISCHTLRKTRAMDLYQAGIPIAYVAQVLGHQNVSTTTGFYAFATLETLQESFELSAPVAYEEEPLWKNKDVLKQLYMWYYPMELANYVKPVNLTINESDIISLSQKGLSFTIPELGIERMFVERKYVNYDKLKGTCSVDLYKNWHYSFRKPDEENVLFNIEGSMLIKSLEKREKDNDHSLARRLMYVERKGKLAETKALAKSLVMLKSNNIDTIDGIENKIKELKLMSAKLREKIKAIDEKNSQYKEAAKYLITYNKYLPLKMEYEKKLRLSKKSFMTKYRSELLAFNHADESLKRLGINTNVDSEKVIALLKNQTKQVSELGDEMKEIDKKIDGWME